MNEHNNKRLIYIFILALYAVVVFSVFVLVPRAECKPAESKPEVSYVWPPAGWMDANGRRIKYVAIYEKENRQTIFEWQDAEAKKCLQTGGNLEIKYVESRVATCYEN